MIGHHIVLYTVDGKYNSHLIGPFKGINKEIKGHVPDLHITFRVLKLRFSGFSRGYGGFRELREADRNHFHLSWYPVSTLHRGKLESRCQYGTIGATNK